MVGLEARGGYDSFYRGRKPEETSERMLGVINREGVSKWLIDKLRGKDIWRVEDVGSVIKELKQKGAKVTKSERVDNIYNPVDYTVRMGGEVVFTASVSTAYNSVLSISANHYSVQGDRLENEFCHIDQNGKKYNPSDVVGDLTDDTKNLLNGVL